MKKRYYSEKNARLSYDNNRKVKIQPLKKAGIIMLIVIFSAVLIFVVYTILDTNLNPPGWWRFERQQDKLVILEYVERNYPNAKNTGGLFPIQKIAEVHRASTMYFELDGIEFSISAEYGEIVEDNYPKARACAQFDKIIKDGFLKPRGITAYTNYGFVDNYYEIYPYTGGLAVELTIWDQGSTPQEIDWLYDFYKYWKKEGESLRLYSVSIDIVADEKKCVISITASLTTFLMRKIFIQLLK